MSYRKNFHDQVYNKGCDWEIEVLFIRNWAEIKELLYKYLIVKVVKGKK